jgi:sec-independent protein translocase protein TatB
MLNVGPLELLVVLAVALIVVGPERLPELARSVGRVLRQFRDVQDEVRNMVSSGVDDDIRDAAAEFGKLTGSITRTTDVKGALRRVERSIQDETVPSPKRPSSDAVKQAGEAGEAGGPPADRLVEDATADPESTAHPFEPPKSADSAPSAGQTELADQTEPETPPQP